MPRSFERATIICRAFSVSGAKETEVINSLCEALALLAEIYNNCTEFKDFNRKDIALADLEKSDNPNAHQGNNRQGYGLNASGRKAVELRAMHIVNCHLNYMGYAVTVTSVNHSFEFLSKKDGKFIGIF